MRNRRNPFYSDDSDYTTNAPSYYDDLARKQKLIKMLAEKIWEYDERLDGRLDDLQQVLNSYLDQWDQRIENLDNEVSHIFVAWLNDGTLEQIINHDVLGNKADKTYVDSEIERLDQKDDDLTSQMTQDKNQFNDFKEMEKYKRNASIPLSIPTYDGSNETTHPSVLFFNGGWNGFSYWMAHTPYPDSNDEYENPSISVSRDGRIWVDFPSSTNPIDEPTQSQIDQGYHMSDTHLVMVNGSLECWYRLNVNGGTEQLLRKKTSDGINWTSREVVLDLTNDNMLALSPSIIYEDGLYKMWFVDNNTIYYTESTSGNIDTWSTYQTVNLSYRDTRKSYWTAWHIDVKKIDGKYVMVINTHAKSGGTRDGIRDRNRDLLLGTSTNGIDFEDIHLLLESSISGWDNWELYRASILKTGNVYKLYYSAKSTQDSWGIGLIQGESLETMTDGGFTVDDNGRMITSGVALSNISYLDRNALVLGVGGKMGTRLRISGDGSLHLESSGGQNTGALNTRFLRASDIENPTNHNNTNMKGLFTFVHADGKPQIKLLDTGVNDGMLTLGDTNHTLRVSATRDPEIKGYLELRGLYLESTTDVSSVAGAIRFNSSTRKHQGHDGTQWNDLY